MLVKVEVKNIIKEKLESLLTVVNQADPQQGEVFVKATELYVNTLLKIEELEMRAGNTQESSTLNDDIDYPPIPEGKDAIKNNWAKTSNKTSKAQHISLDENYQEQQLVEETVEQSQEPIVVKTVTTETNEITEEVLAHETQKEIVEETTVSTPDCPFTDAAPVELDEKLAIGSDGVTQYNITRAYNELHSLHENEEYRVEVATLLTEYQSLPVYLEMGPYLPTDSYNRAKLASYCTLYDYDSICGVVSNFTDNVKQDLYDFINEDVLDNFVEYLDRVAAGEETEAE